MLCEKCGKKEAEVYIHNTINGQETELNLCRECAEEAGYLGAFRGFSPWKSFISDDLGLFSDLWRPGALRSGSGTCPGCGLTAAQAAAMGKAGCAQCYDAFPGVFGPIIRRIHGDAEHKGSAPASLGGEIARKARLRDAREELKKAISEENFEQAAVLRDEIRALEKEGEQHA